MDANMKIVVGCDLAAYDFKVELVRILREKGYDITDIGCDSSAEGEYTEYGRMVGEAVAGGKYDRGIVICGTGNGICMAANKVRGVRAALCYDVFPALMSREHNNANVLALGSWVIDIPKAVRVTETWLFGKFSGGRHEKRVEALKMIEDERLSQK